MPKLGIFAHPMTLVPTLVVFHVRYHPVTVVGLTEEASSHGIDAARNSLCEPRESFSQHAGS
jgi:hypothetical protein